MISQTFFSFQYPVRPGRMTYDDVDIHSARVKPVQKKVNDAAIKHSIKFGTQMC